MKKRMIIMATVLLLAGCSKKVEKKIEQPKETVNSHFKVIKHYEIKATVGEGGSFHYLDGNKLYTSIERENSPIFLGYQSKSLGYIDITNGKYIPIYHFKGLVRCWDFFVHEKGFYSSEFKEDGEKVTVQYKTNGQSKKIDEGVLVNPWAIPNFQKIEGNRLLYQIITKEKGHYFYHLKTVNLSNPSDIKILYKGEAYPKVSYNYQYCVNRNKVTFNKTDGKKGWHLSLDLKTGKVSDITSVIKNPTSNTIYLGNNQYLFETNRGHRGIIYDVEKKKEILSFGGSTGYLVGIGDRYIFAVFGLGGEHSLDDSGELVELKDGKTRIVKVKGYKNVGSEGSLMFYGNGKLVTATQKLANYNKADRHHVMIIDLLEESNEKNS
ncbi:hypothetical protein [Bulleidia sp. zg-1006]|uniref:hypothetical protein n=1 Tax=Bulleidia sp. zg-1006 TaxID=2806552 RepID=UPI0019396678|nr:hypothetical protein [Bulleidia sp. zg-1006]QRG86711.1 hypothetical protein JOS54_07690 [Bulleidia sp. zg-1006]